MATASEHTFRASESSGDVSALLVRPEGATCLYVFAHGAGAGMR
ncbi:MAG: alpha/beta hydrolase, partial [Gemmatimonadota bacterium]